MLTGMEPAEANSRRPEHPAAPLPTHRVPCASGGQAGVRSASTAGRCAWRVALLLFAGSQNGATAPYTRFWGDTHGHTVLSDGQGTPDDYFAHARDVAKLDFAILTDHDFGHENPWRMPKEHWQAIQDAADKASVRGRFVGIAGYEWTSQAKYWAGFSNGVGSELLFPGTPRHFSHKNVYFLGRVDYLFSAKEAAYHTPDLLAAAVQQAGGLIHNNHPSSDPDSREQFVYRPAGASVIANSEVLADEIRYEGKSYRVDGERVLREFLDRGGQTGFLGGSDTHEGRPRARTAVLARALTRQDLFDALRHRRVYAVSNARIVLDFRINGHFMGEEIQLEGAPLLTVTVRGTARIAEIAVVRNGTTCHRTEPEGRTARVVWRDPAFPGSGYYYVRVTQADADDQGNPSRAWSSPIWVERAHLP